MKVDDPVIVFALPVSVSAPSAIGGEGYFPNIASLLAPWVTLGVVLVGGITWFVVRRRSA
jgi:hypothetical protein